MTTTQYRLAWLITIGTALFLVLASGAVGIIGDGGRPDLMYAGVLAVLLVGTAVARLRPAGMAWALTATAIAQVLVGVVALGLVGLDEVTASVVDLVGINAMFAVLFGASAWLFGRSARGPERPASIPTNSQG